MDDNLLFAIATVVVSTPGLPKTGFPSKTEGNIWNIMLSFGAFALSLISVVLLFKKDII